MLLERIKRFRKNALFFPQKQMHSAGGTECIYFGKVYLNAVGTAFKPNK